MRDVEAVLAAEGDEEVVAGDARDLSRLEAEQPADAVVLVDDVVAGAQVGERLQRAAEARVDAARAAAEDLRVGQEHEAELAPDEAAPRRRDREQELGLGGEIALEHPRLDLAQQPLGARRLAAVRERDDDAQAGTNERGELVLGLGEPARGDRGPLRLEREGLPHRQRVELGGAVERHGPVALLLPDRPHLVGLPHEVGPARKERHEIAGHGPRLALLPVPVLDEVEPPLGRRVDHRLRDRVQRALGERRERADRLDLVAEELDAQRLAARRREDVEDAAADRELAALVGPLGPLVARERELLGEPVDARLVAEREPQRRRPGLGRRRRSASAAAEAQTSPPAASTSRARARSPTRCGGGSSPDSHRTPRPGSSATRSSPRNQPAASAASRASASSARRQTSGRPSSSQSAASTSGSAGSETRARAGSACANACSRSCAASSRTKA